MHPSDSIEAQLADLRQRQSPCRLCPRNCGTTRIGDDLGYCRAPLEPVVVSAGPHFGEERVLVGTGGSGTLFLSGCNLLCAFCQNWDISHRVAGPRWHTDDMVYAMLRLADAGCENINFVTPTHHAPQIAEAVLEARRRRMHLPVVYNCGGYESADTLRLLDGIVNIYMPDFKFWRSASADRYAHAPDYPQRARESIREMYRQVGDLVVENEIARRGVLVRHLVMPGATDEGRDILDWLATEVSIDTYVNVMGQYRPMHRAGEFPEIDRRATDKEIADLKTHARQLGLRLAE